MQRDKSRLLLVFTLALTALLLASCASTIPVDSESTQLESQANSESMEKEEGSIAQDEESTQEEKMSADENSSKPAASEDSDQTVGFYIPLATYEADKSKYAKNRIILFFNASWCSTCKVARDNFEASKAEIPGDMTIVIVDYDNSETLRAKYGVTLQHTFVQVDANGQQLAKWSGSKTISELEDQAI